jgi:hypothetical protein
MYKSKNELAPEYLSNLIVSANNKESYDTRFSSSDNFLVPKPNNEYCLLKSCSSRIILAALFVILVNFQVNIYYNPSN